MTRELSLRHWPKDVRGLAGEVRGSCRAPHGWPVLLQCLLRPGTRQRGGFSALQGRKGRCGEASRAGPSATADRFFRARTQFARLAASRLMPS
jgi:hypothetical protein